MKMNIRTKCPLCNSTNISLYKKGTLDPNSLQTKDFDVTSHKYGLHWTFFSCHDCFFVFSNPSLSNEDAVLIYSAVTDEEYLEEAHQRAKSFHTILNRIKKLTKSKRILDIGAAGGIFLHLAQQEAFQIQGIEPSHYFVEEAFRHYSISLFQGTLDNFIDSNKDKLFPIITLLDIIEHIAEPQEFFSKVHSLLEDDGLLVIVTPHIGSFFSRVMRGKWWHLRPGHLNFFSLSSLQYLLHKYNLQICKIKRYSWHFSLYYILSRLFPSLKQRPSLQKILKKVHLRLPLRDSWEIYARKKQRHNKSEGYID